MTGYAVIDDYIAEVRRGAYPECREQAALCDYVERVFATERLRVDLDQLDRYFRFERFFPFELLLWERFVFALHNCVYKPNGLLRWPVLFCLLGRGAGKNGFLSFECFCWLTPVNGVKNYDVDIFAMSEDQAKTSFEDVYNVLEEHKGQLGKFFKWNLEVIRNIATGSKLKFRTSGVKTKDGGRPGAVAFDELHAYENYKLLDVATTGLGKKEHPRRTILTTDGDVRGGPLDDYKGDAEDVLFHDMPDNGVLYFICKLDDPAEVDDKAMWHKANPSLRYFPTLQQELETEYATYKRNPTGNSSFLVKRMNVPKTIDAQSVADWEKIKACNRPLPALDYCPCVAGLDYAKTTDFVCAGLLFRAGEEYLWMQHTWVCRASLDLPKIKAPLDEWEDKGYITYVDGPEIPPDVPAEWLEAMGQRYDIKVLGIDNFRITLMAKALKEHGFDSDKGGADNIRLCKRVTQNRYAPVITSLFNTGKIAWGDDPMMPWYTWNVAVETERGNQYYSKKDPERRKTDGFMAFVAALCAADNLEDCGAPADLGDFGVLAF